MNWPPICKRCGGLAVDWTKLKKGQWTPPNGLCYWCLCTQDAECEAAEQMALDQQKDEEHHQLREETGLK